MNILYLHCKLMYTISHIMWIFLIIFYYSIISINSYWFVICVIIGYNFAINLLIKNNFKILVWINILNWFQYFNAYNSKLYLLVKSKKLKINGKSCVQYKYHSFKINCITTLTIIVELINIRNFLQLNINIPVHKIWLNLNQF